MKKYFIILLLLATSCQKEDYRDAYVGIYDCTDGSIRSVLPIDNYDDYNIKIETTSYVYLDENGYFKAGPTGGEEIEGWFINDSLYFTKQTKYSYEEFTCLKR